MPTTIPSDWSTLGTTWLVGGIVAAGLVGLVMLLWGRLFHRALLVLAAAGLGLLLGGRFSPQIAVSAWLAQLVGAVTLGVLALVLARLVWSILAGLHVGAIAVVVVAVWVLGVSVAATQPAVQADPAACLRAVEQDARAVWADHALTVNLTAILAGLSGLVAAFLLPRVTVICMTSLIGTALLLTAGGLAVASWFPALLAGSSPSSRYVPGGLAGGVLLLGLLFQAVGELRARRRASARADEREPKRASSPAESG